jgi:hypothetical protein
VAPQAEGTKLRTVRMGQGGCLWLDKTLMRRQQLIQSVDLVIRWLKVSCGPRRATRWTEAPPIGIDDQGHWALCQQTPQLTS